MCFRCTTGKGAYFGKKILAGRGRVPIPSPRGTPTIEDNRIYLIGGDAALVCLNARNGELIWKQNPHSSFFGKIPTLGNR